MYNFYNMFEKNTPSPWTWQGNKLQAPFWANFIGLGLVVLIIFYMWARRYKIAENYEQQTRKFYIFGNTDIMLKAVSLIWLALGITKTVFIILSGYPLVWEHIPFHMCRLHAYIIPLLILFNKKEWMKYIVYPALIGSMFGMGFWRIDFSDSTFPINELAKENGFTFYRLGPDSLIWWEFWVTHIFVAIMPIYVLIANTYRIRTRDLTFTLIGYSIIFILLFIVNWLTKEFATNPAWQTNYFYVGDKNANAYTDALGPISNWPYSLFTYIAIFFVVSAALHRSSIWISNYRLRENGEWFKYVKSDRQMIFEANKGTKFWKITDY